MVGVGFFSGIQITAPNIQQGAYNYYKDTNLFDLKIVSTQGFSEQNLVALNNIEGVDRVEASYVADGVSKDNIIRVHALNDTLNTVTLIEGRLPQNNQEALGDARHFNIGDTLTFEDVDQNLSQHSFKIVGLTQSSLYMSEEYGPSHKGNGKLSTFIFVNENAFDTTIIPEVVISIKDSSKLLGTSDYVEAVNDVEKAVLAISETQTLLRLHEIQDDAYAEVDTNQAELDSQKQEAYQKIENAEKELANNQITLNEAFATLNVQEQELLKQSSEKRQEINANQAEIDQKRFTIVNNLEALGLSYDSLPSKIDELSQTMESITLQLEGLDSSSPEYLSLKDTYDMVATQHDGLLQMKLGMERLDEAQATLTEGLNTLNNESQSAQIQIDEARYTLQRNQNELNDGFANLKDQKAELAETFEAAQKELDEAREAIASLNAPKWYTFSQETTGAYKELESSVKVISSVAKVFPIFFILIAMLMTSNSMARMINEERSELGTLTSLGFSNTDIVKTYIFYALSVSIIGVVTGYFMGIFTIPPLIYKTFSKFLIPEFAFMMDLRILFLSVILASGLMAFVSIRACMKELQGKPATLLRPLPPKQGKKILLQNVGFIWNALSFNWKVTYRNIFRYKKRGFMTLIGVSGCTALLLVGFGLRDSINGVEASQYGEIFKYESMLTLHDNQDTSYGALSNDLARYGIDDFASIQQTPFSAYQGNSRLDLYVMTFDVNQSYDTYFGLVDTQSGNPVSPTQGISITEKLADILKVNVGDTISIENREFEQFDLKINAIVRNYLSHYVYIDSQSYAAIFGEEPEINTVVTNVSLEFNNELKTQIIEDQTAIHIIGSQELAASIQKTNQSLDAIVVLIVFVAALLAFVVLYNLTSINISERKRELATLKVLGFYDQEANGYVYREALILTLVSIICGLALGIVLHRYVLAVIESTGIMFFKTIQIPSFLFAAAITLAISLIMQIVTYFVIKRINMIEALKSNE